MRPDLPAIWVVGGGSLASSICHSLAVVAREPVAVTIVARSERGASGLCYVAGTRAGLAGAPVRFTYRIISLDSADELASALASAPPDVVINAVSLQSPWEALHRPSAWTDLTRASGLGLTLPLQTVLATRVAQAIVRGAPGARYINAAYPDAVNPVLRSLGLPVLAGIGNAQLLAGTLQARLKLADQRDLKLLAHHLHLGQPGSAPELQAWLADRPIPDVTSLLCEQRAAPRHTLNAVTGYAAASFLCALISGETFHTSLPGPHGLPGGYPVRTDRRAVELDLPPGVTRASAIAFNQQLAVAEGVRIADGRIEFGPRVRRYAADVVPESIEAAGLDRLAGRLIRLREDLRRRAARSEDDAARVVRAPFAVGTVGERPRRGDL